MQNIPSTNRGRPPIDTTYGTMSAANHETGASLGWSDGEWQGPKVHVLAALRLADERALLPVPKTGAFAEASSATPMGAYVILADLAGPKGAVHGDLPFEDLAYLTHLALDGDDDLDEDVA